MSSSKVLWKVVITLALHIVPFFSNILKGWFSRHGNVGSLTASKWTKTFLADWVILTWVVLSLNFMVIEQLTISPNVQMCQENRSEWEGKTQSAHVCGRWRRLLCASSGQPRCSSFAAQPRSETWNRTCQSFGWTLLLLCNSTECPEKPAFPGLGCKWVINGFLII